MFDKTNRRQFVTRAAVASSAVGTGSLAFLSNLHKVSADEAAPSPNIVRLRPEIEPLVQMIEDTPRESLLEKMAAEVKGGVSYQHVLAALMLAGVRNVQPRPSVGFKFHAVLVVNSAHLASISSPDEHRWLPIFWALDEFKSSQAADVREGNWTMAPVKEAAIPKSSHARDRFIDAMDSWDAEAADASVAALARTAGVNDTFELLFRYGARDFRAIGHKAIFVANSLRTLQCIGWQHSEPILRSLAYALQNHTGEPNPSESDLDPDRPWRQNTELAKQLSPDWQAGSINEQATVDMLASLRSGTASDSCTEAVRLIQAGHAPQSIWDAIFLSGGELLMRRPGIVALHSLTSANALHYAYQTSQSDQTRKMMMLQAAAFIPLFREAMFSRNNDVADVRIDQFEAAELDAAGHDGLAEIFNSVGRENKRAAGQVLTYLDAGKQARELIDAARLLIFLKGNNSHDYKFSSAVMEDYYHVSPSWRNRLMAASVYNLRGAQDVDNSLVERIRSALS